MRQTVVTLSAEVQPRSLDALKVCIRDLKRAVENPAGSSGGDPYQALGDAVPSLHFASIMVFEDQHYDPLLTVELNVDGDIGPFLPQLETAGLQPYLRTMVRCCKRPLGAPGKLYDIVTAPGSKAPLAPFLESRIVRPAVFHQGNRGLDRNRILREAALFADVQAALGKPDLYRAPDAVTLHRGLRSAMMAKHPWLGSPAAERVTRAETLADASKLVGFLAVALVCLAIPGMVLALLLPRPIAGTFAAVAAILIVAMIVGVWVRFRWHQQPAATIPGMPVVPPPTPLAKLEELGLILAAMVGFAVIGAFVGTVLLWPLYGIAFEAIYKVALAVVTLGLATVPIMLALIVVGVRGLENRDSTQEDPHDDKERLQAILAAEDHIAQNHMGSVVLIKPGMLRAILIRAGLWGLGLLLRVTATDGYLASMRTIHFAHWAMLNNGGRLVFFSNFDSSWESYLDDFIEKAHVGLTLAWTNGVGFPPTEFLINKGATSGRLFKAWARHSMAEGLFWFSAYKDLSVNQIERQYLIAAGLCRARLSAAEAMEWAHNL